MLVDSSHAFLSAIFEIFGNFYFDLHVMNLSRVCTKTYGFVTFREQNREVGRELVLDEFLRDSHKNCNLGR